MFVKNELGNKVYVWTRGGGKSNQQSEAVISSHGGQAIFNNKFEVPQGITLKFYCPHGWVLQDPSLFDVILGKATVAEEVVGKKSFVDYKLSKFQGAKHGSAAEAYDKIAPLGKSKSDLIGEGWTEEQLEGYAEPLPMDVITIRSRNMRISPMLSDVIKMLQSNGWNYTTIHCSFCRCPRMKDELGTWDALGNQAVPAKT